MGRSLELTKYCVAFKPMQSSMAVIVKNFYFFYKRMFKSINKANIYESWKTTTYLYKT